MAVEAEKTVLKPNVLWAERANCVFITFEVGCDGELPKQLALTDEKTLAFEAEVDGKLYKQELKLADAVDVESIKVRSKRVVEVYIEKQEDAFWEKLTASKTANVKIDWAKWKDEDEADGNDFNTAGMEGMPGGMGGMGGMPGMGGMGGMPGMGGIPGMEGMMGGMPGMGGMGGMPGMGGMGGMPGMGGGAGGMDMAAMMAQLGQMGGGDLGDLDAPVNGEEGDSDDGEEEPVAEVTKEDAAEEPAKEL